MLFPTTRIPEHCPSYMPNSPLDETCNGVRMLAVGLANLERKRPLQIGRPNVSHWRRTHLSQAFLRPQDASLRKNWRAISRHASIVLYLCVIGSSVTFLKNALGYDHGGPAVLTLFMRRALCHPHCPDNSWWAYLRSNLYQFCRPLV